MSSNYPSHILLFDGVCNLCNSTVNFLIKRDKKQLFTFASLQSNAGQALLAKFSLPQQEFHSFVYVKGDQFYQRSGAVLRVLKDMGGIWKLAAVLLLLPTPLRDFIYNIIAKNRYRWFGKKNECMLPTPELKKRFLD
jgi:predicted DCC family thiol-disulfide oxidoreductase YuxK